MRIPKDWKKAHPELPYYFDSDGLFTLVLYWHGIDLVFIASTMKWPVLFDDGFVSVHEKEAWPMLEPWRKVPAVGEPIEGMTDEKTIVQPVQEFVRWTMSEEGERALADYYA